MSAYMFVFYGVSLLVVIYLFYAICKHCDFSLSRLFIIDLWSSFTRPFGSKQTVYTSGTILLLLLCVAILMLFLKFHANFSLSVWDLPLLFPAFGLFTYFAWNWKLSREPDKLISQGSLSPYEIEVELIKFVERHSNYMIFAVTGVFIAAQYFTPNHNLSMFYLFTFMSLLFSIWGVLPLIWSPKEATEHLEWLRHYKTVWYGYSIFLLCAGILSFAKAMLLSQLIK